MNSPTVNQTYIQRMHKYFTENEQRLTIAFFVLGFLLDMVMLDRIDSLSTIGQQGAFLIVIMAGLCQMFFEQNQPEPNLQQMFIFKRWFYEYRIATIHLLYGALLNGYTLFFFKSSSLVVSFIFMTAMVALLIANESHRFKRSGLSFKFGLLTLCLLCYFAYLVPVMAGSISVIVFLLSMLLGCVPLVYLGWWIQSYRPLYFERAKSQILIPMSVVVLAFLTLYVFKLIPPVPLSVEYIGVYHSVEKTAGDYTVSHQRPWWRFWHNGDQNFMAQRGDKIHVFFRLFSPTRFSDEVSMRWYWKDNSQGWVLQDSIPIRIVGGRDQGFRGFGVKSNYQPGDWKVQIETTDGREIGRVYFELELIPEGPRSFEREAM